MPVLRDAWKRRLLILAAAAALALFALFPQRYRAVTSLAPTDPGSLGLGGTLGQLGATNSVFGNQTAIEVSLKLAQSPYVSDEVMKRLDLPERLDRSPLKTSRWLHRKVDIRVMRGGIMQIETTLSDAKLGKEIVATYAEALRNQLTRVARNQTRYKREILVDLVQRGKERLDLAQAAYDRLRLRTRYSAPESAIATIGERIPQLEAMIKSKENELATAEHFATARNFSVQRIQAELSALHEQLAEARSASPTDPDAVGRVVRQSTEADRLKRDLDIALRLYESYKRYLEGTSVEDLISAVNIRILEPAYIDSERQYNWSFIWLIVLLGLAGLAIEFYNLRPPVGAPEPA